MTEIHKEAGQSFIPGLSLPDFAAMQGPLLKDDSILNFGGKGIADIFNKDVLEDAKAAVGPNFLYLYGTFLFNQAAVANLAADSPIMPVGSSSSSSGEFTFGVDGPEQVMGGWFTTSMILKLSVNMVGMARDIMEMNLVQLASTLKAIMMIMELAKDAGEAIRQSGEAQAKIYEYQAIQGIMQAVGGAIQIVMAVGSIYGTANSKWNPQKGHMDYKNSGQPHGLSTFALAGGPGALGAIFSGVGQAITGFATATLSMQKADWDALKEMLTTLIQFFEKSMQSSIKTREEYEDMIKKTLDQLAQITTEARRAAGINPHRT